MPLVRVYRVEPRSVTTPEGVTVTDPVGLVRPILSVGVAGQEYRARGQRPGEREYGVMDLPPAAIATLRAHGSRVVAA